MIKALIHTETEEHPVVLFGLSGEDVTRLAAGEAVEVDLAKIGLDPYKIVLMYGKTETDIVKEMRQSLRGKMRIHPPPEG